MTFKKILPLILVVLGLFICVAEIAAEVDVDHYQDVIFSIIYNLGGIVEDNPASEIVYNTFMVADEAVRNRDVNFGIDTSLDTVLSGMYFNIHESGETSLVFGLTYLDTYRPGSSIHYSILIHEFRHLHDYMTNREAFLAARNDEKHSYWYELDALRVEAEFVNYYFGDRVLTHFEEFLRESFIYDNLNSASIICLRESMNYFFYFNYLELSYLNNEIPGSEIIDELLLNGEMLLDYYNSTQDEYLSFFHYIEIITYRKYLIRLMIIIMDNPSMTWGEVFDIHPAVGRLYYEMSDILNSHHNRQMEYLSTLIQYWEDDIHNSINF